MLKQKIEAQLERYFRDHDWMITRGRDLVASDDGECDCCGEPIDGSEVNLSKLAEQIAEHISNA